jgi:hypothetical protein
MKRISFLIVCVAVALSFSTSAFCKASSKKVHGKSVAKSKIIVLSGKVLETMDGGGYTYAKIDDEGKMLWLAMPTTKLKVGQDYTFNPGQEMRNFKSEALKRTFDSILFTNGLLVLPGTEEYRAKNKVKTSVKVKVAKAKGSEARTVAEVYQDKASLGGKKVSVRGKVVKISMGIMGKNWVHIQDGTGSPEKGTNDLVVTTLDESASIGDVVTATGTVTPDKDFGYGYRYDVIMEQAEIKK